MGGNGVGCAFAMQQLVLESFATPNGTYGDVFKVPLGATALKIELWGSGRQGGQSGTVTGGGGGGGGAYSRVNAYDVTGLGGRNYDLLISDESDSTFKETAANGGATICKAERGVAGQEGQTSNQGAGGAGGTTAGSVGDVKFAGGAGGGGGLGTATGGGGGGGAGSTGAGGAGNTNGTAGTAGTPDGVAGAIGATLLAPGGLGMTGGGGGGGASTLQVKGFGSTGKFKITVSF